MKTNESFADFVVDGAHSYGFGILNEEESIEIAKKIKINCGSYFRQEEIEGYRKRFDKENGTKEESKEKEEDAGRSDQT